MIISSILLLLLSNAVTLRRDKSILYSRISMIILIYSCLIGYNNLDFSFLENGIGLFGGLFHATCITNVFHIFILLLSSIILLFIVTGALFLMSTNDLVSIFLSIELQSYGLYLLSTIYRNSESATSGGLMYFLLGGLSSCFILLLELVHYTSKLVFDLNFT